MHRLPGHDGAVVTVTLSRPERHNAQTPATWLGLREVGRRLDRDVRVVIVRGAGPSFSSGLDRAVMAAGLDAGEAEITAFQEGFSWLGRPDLISVAAVQGYALGAGCQLALACDLRVLSEDAQLALPEPSLGIVPDLGGTHPLVRAVGYSLALEICLTGRRIGAAEAFRIGLANVVVPDDQLDSAVLDLVAAVLGPVRGAATETKALLAAALRQDVEEQRAAERAAQVRRLAALRGAAG
ncbi:MAG TPA: enoyl-CoA hydratase/isomerase family protein [Mycobacteriales bacterium]|nr:enoyl-CoA hydratase/isomerase family protein [Mycobacteriales bacterium]